MNSIWALAKIDELEFSAAATLLAIRAEKKSIIATEQPEDYFSDESESEFSDKEDCITSRPTARLATHSQSALIDKFLNRLAEVFSPEKSSIQRGSFQGAAKHVAATAWVRPSIKCPLTIIVAKNEGLDDRYRGMSALLQLWLRTVSTTRRHPKIETDIIWIGKPGLVEYCRGRLWYHISQINKLNARMESLALESGIYSPKTICLQRLCQTAAEDLTVKQLSDIVNTAYEILYAYGDLRTEQKYVKVLRSIGMLGRLRAAYECFKSIALSVDGVSTLEIKPVNFNQPVEIDVARFQVNLRKLRKIHQLPKKLLKNKDAQRYTGASRRHAHAEMQILESLANNADWQSRAHHYIGISRKPCFLCHEILQSYHKITMEGARQPAYRVRRSHGKIYPLWALPSNLIEPQVSALAMATAVTNVYRKMQHILQQGPLLQPPIAESSVGITDSASISCEFSAMKDSTSQICRLVPLRVGQNKSRNRSLSDGR